MGEWVNQPLASRPVQQEAMMKLKWYGEPSKRCQVCGTDLRKKNIFVDGRLLGGPWAILCRGCHEAYGVGLGTGKGQMYVREADGTTWNKVAG
jgi:hypothetical protein